MKGKYVFYENGRKVREQENLITTEGRRAILKYLARRTTSIAGAIAVGTGSTAATITDKSMEFEINRSDITGIAPDYTTKSLVYKSTISAAVAGVINEVGLWTKRESGNYSSKILSNFDNSSGVVTTLTNAVYDPANARVGVNGIKVTVPSNTTTTATLTNLKIDISGYSSVDEFALALYNSNATQVVLRFKTDASNYITYTKVSPAAGYSINRFQSGSWTTTGTPNLTNITSLDLVATATGTAATVTFDALRVEDRDLDPDIYTLVSHAILVTPYTKVYGVPTDVEYILDVT